MLGERPSKYCFNLFSFCFLILSQKPGNYPVSFLPIRNWGNWEPHTAETQEKLKGYQTISAPPVPNQLLGFSLLSQQKLEYFVGFVCLFLIFENKSNQISCYPESVSQALSHHNWEFSPSFFLVAFTSVWIIISSALLFLQEPFQGTKPIPRRILWHWGSSYLAVIPLEKASTSPPHI